MRKIYIYFFMLFVLFSAGEAFAENFRLCVGATQPITPALSEEKDGKVLMSLDILTKLGLEFVSSGSKMIELTEKGKTLKLYNNFGVSMISILELSEVLDVNYERRKNNIVITNKIESVVCESGYVNFRFAFSSAYEYSYINNSLVLDLVGAVYNSKTEIINRDPANVLSVSSGQQTLDAARCVVALANLVSNKKAVRGRGKELNLKLEEGLSFTLVKIKKLECTADFRDNIIKIYGGASLKCDTEQDIYTGKILITLTNGSFEKSVQKTYKTGTMIFDVKKNTISAQAKEIKSISQKVSLGDLYITVSPERGVGIDIHSLRVCIDAGHGGKDTGTTYKDSLEKDINYKAAVILSEKLAQRGMKPALTREDDRYIEVMERPEIANRQKSHVFISIHVNSVAGENRVSGFEMYCRYNMYSSEYLGKLIHREIVSDLPIPDKGLKKDSVLYKSGLGVLRGCRSHNIPCVLIEMGFLNHYTDRNYLLDEAYISYLAESIADALEKYATGKPLNELGIKK
ncbi:MAG: N-acetylmuramoyl-L-alanine amidase [Armatimonadetes bacterium]|nr:N-acetylmuramoyl-L-alanine amidase [Candidatus Hippobium faecium]